MQVFNQINARKLKKTEINVFGGIFANWLFLFVTFITFGVQMMMVEVGGKITKTYPFGVNDNMICMGIGAGELIWGLIIKFLPLGWFQCINFDETPMTPEQEAASVKGRLKASTSLVKK